jgi:membrane protease YdiL (CAAX protease family)
VANEAEQSLVGFAEAFGIVAGASVAVAVVAVLVIRALKLPLIPKWHAPGAVWPGGVVLGLFLAYYVGMPTAMTVLDQTGAYQRLYGPDFPRMMAPPPAQPDPADAAARRGQQQLRAIWAGFLVVPLLVGLAVFLRAKVLNQPPALAEYAKPFPSRVAFGIWTGLFLVPVAFAIHALALWAAEQAGVALDRHPLTDLTPAGDGFGGVVFALSVILFGPVVEELLFRGLIVNWAGGEWHRPWVVMAFAGILASLRGMQFDPQFGPTVFVALLGVGLYVIQRFAFLVWPTFPTRTVAAVWSSAALFAAAHSSVWPTPIPLFVLALGLGYLTARTRDITAAVVVHGMFNAVSFVYLLRGGAG